MLGASSNSKHSQNLLLGFQTLHGYSETVWDELVFVRQPAQDNAAEETIVSEFGSLFRCDQLICSGSTR